MPAAPTRLFEWQTNMESPLKAGCELQRLWACFYTPFCVPPLQNLHWGVSAALWTLPTSPSCKLYVWMGMS